MVAEAQVNGAVALGLSQVLLEEAVYEKGMPLARNFDMYPILPPDRMARVHVRIIESGEKMGGIGEPPLPAVPPAVANAVSRLTARAQQAEATESTPAESGNDLGSMAGELLGGFAGQVMKTAMRQAANQLGRQLVRGVLGSLLGGKRR